MPTYACILGIRRYAIEATIPSQAALLCAQKRGRHNTWRWHVIVCAVDGVFFRPRIFEVDCPNDNWAVMEVAE